MNKVPEIVQTIYQTFIDYFGEVNVDLQSYENNIIHLDHTFSEDYVILVHWREVTITNEYDESIDIWDLYSAVPVSPTGKLKHKPYFTRSTYDEIQWNSKYCHSHLPSLDQRHCETFRGSCLGSGPIDGTIQKLKCNDADLDIWRLFCWELDKYVHVESLHGGPYRRLKDVGKELYTRYESFNIKFSFPEPSNRLCKACTKTIIDIIIKKNILRYNFFEGRYLLGTSYVDTVLAISNAFIEWYNSTEGEELRTSSFGNKEQLIDNHFIETAYVANGAIVTQNDRTQNYSMPEGQELFTFKNKTVTLQMKKTVGDYNAGAVTIINIDILDYIIYIILRYLNLYYGKPGSTINRTAKIV